ncbi:hypothetical protein [Paenibacillus nasutitermitis]|uniref:hypothetical protein n=1 Tax=Paenibacillus nasutitermitis TaxID=1652958 RepID=UPI001E3AE2AB|nr:hypothetical protein [Paenibacillus nasutitermitis]
MLNANELQPLSFDEKPGIKPLSIQRKTCPVPGEHPTISRDSEYKRNGTLSLLAGIDLVTGEVIGSIEERHRSREFVDFLKKLDAH